MQLLKSLKTFYSGVLVNHNWKLNKSKVFCMAPWIQLHAQTNGKVAPCCMSAMNMGNELGDLKEDPNLENVWNSDAMKQLRKNMLCGKKSSICMNCYDYEKVGKFSERMQYNKDHKDYYSRVTATLPDGSLSELSIPLIDVRFSNKCNYKCRICDSEYSTQWYEEQLKLGKPVKSGAVVSKELKVADNESAFWNSYIRLLSGVKRLHFAGGEPLFMDEHYNALAHLVAIGRTDVTLSYNTNFSILRYKQHNLIDLWNKFTKVDVWASLDGMGEQGDYQRKGQNWKKIEENIRLVQKECPSVLFGVNVTVSIFNILHIPAFYQYMVDNELVQHDRMNLYLLFDPSYMRITNLPAAVKQKAITQFDELEKNYLKNLPDASRIRNHIKAVINYMMSEDGSEGKEFKYWVKEVDKLRGESFEKVFPELALLMEEQ